MTAVPTHQRRFQLGKEDNGLGVCITRIRWIDGSSIDITKLLLEQIIYYVLPFSD